MSAFHLYDGFDSGVNAYWADTDFFQYSNTIQSMNALEGGFDNCIVWPEENQHASISVLPTSILANEDFIFEIGVRLNDTIIDTQATNRGGISLSIGNTPYLLYWESVAGQNSQTILFANNGTPTSIPVNYPQHGLVKLRFRRVANYLSAYYYNGLLWIQIGSSALNTNSATVSLEVSNAGSTNYNPGLSYIDFRKGTPEIQMTVNNSVVTSAKAPADVLFAITGFEAYGDMTSIISTKWTFGDGLFSPLLSPVHTYGMHGKYYVNCLITYADAEGVVQTTTLYATFIASRQVNIVTLDKCYRVGFYKSQGMGPSEFSGDYWPQFPVGVGGAMCYDDNDQPHHIVFDEKYGIFKEISAPNGPDGSGLVKTWTDDDATGSPHEIVSEISLAEITGDRKHFQIEHNETHLYFKPFNEDTRDATGHDENGYRDAQQVDIDCYLNGEQTQPNAESLDIPKIGEIVFDRRMIGQRGRMVVKMAAAEYVLTGYDQYWIEKDQAVDISDTPNSEADCQLALSLLELWITRGNEKLLYDRIYGKILTCAYGTPAFIQGADGKSNSGFSFTGVIELGLYTFLGVGAISFFYKGAPKIVLNGTEQTIVNHPQGIFDGWNLGYVLNMNGHATYLPMEITSTGTSSIFDLRTGKAYVPSVSVLSYLYNDVRYNHGDNVCPIW